MGSRTPDEYRQGPNGMARSNNLFDAYVLTRRAESPAGAATTVVNPPKPAAASGLLQGVLEGRNEDGDDDDDWSGANIKSDGQPSTSEPACLT
jgi:methionyl aminopeptidase